MALRLKLSEIGSQPVIEQQQLFDSLIASAKARRNGQAALIQQRIREFERRYEMTSEELKQRLRDDSVVETAEIAQWLFLLSSQENRTLAHA